MALGIPHYIDLSPAGRAVVVAAEAEAEGVLRSSLASVVLHGMLYTSSRRLDNDDRARIRAAVTAFGMSAVSVFARQVLEAARMSRLDVDKVQWYVEERLTVVVHHAYHDIDAEKVKSAFNVGVGTDADFRCKREIENQVKASYWTQFLADLGATGRALSIAPSAENIDTREAAEPTPALNGRGDEPALVEVHAPAAGGERWCDVQIRFLSDFKIQSVVKGKVRESQNYAELGFGDQRSKDSKPRAAWETLRLLAEGNGVISSTPTATEWPKLEKRIQEIRRRLKAVFCIEGDPVPYVDGAYKAQFKIAVTPPYHA